jgi:tetratricopeptide (TPR) repeat protein
MGHAQTLPFELDVFRARCRLWAGDHLGHLDALHALLRKCKSAARMAGRKAAGPPRGAARPSATPATDGGGAGEAEAAKKTKEVSEEQMMWIERAARVGLILASALVDMKEHEAAIALLEPLLKQSTPSSTSMPELKSAIARIKLQAGLVQDARETFKEIEADEGVSSDAKDFNTAILASAEGEWEVCAEILARLAERDERVEGEKGSSEDQREDRKAGEDGANRVAVANNLAVALLAQGRISDAVDALEARMKEEPKAVASVEGTLFNLGTCADCELWGVG